MLEAKLAGTKPGQRLTAPVPRGDVPAAMRAMNTVAQRPAAVLVPLVKRPDGLQVLLTQRTDHLKRHAGQVSFPGGSLETADDGPLAAALRETEEEIGLTADFVQVLGYLDDYLTITGFAVTPVVALVQPGFTLALDPHEVAEAFEVPLSHLLDERSYRRRAVKEMAGRVGYYEVLWRERRIWGATAGMLAGLYELLHGRALRAPNEK